MSHLNPLEKTYQSYIAAINSRDWSLIASQFTRPSVKHNDKQYTAAEYTEMIEDSIEPYGPQVDFVPVMIIADTDRGTIGARLMIETSKGVIWENVFYQCVEGRISEVWSLVDSRGVSER